MKRGYGDPRYLESLREFGRPVRLAGSISGWLEREIPGSDLRDLRAPYPLLQCGDWDALALDFERSDGAWVSATAVPDPLTAPDSVTLKKLFPDLCRPYKEHFIVGLDGGYEGPYASGHRRNVARARRECMVESVPASATVLETWVGLYGELVHRHGILGIAGFSALAFTEQFALSGLRIYQTRADRDIVAMTLWLVDGERAYYHLGASSEEGYRRSANFGMFDLALKDFAQEGIRCVLLGAGAGTYSAGDDGLTRFKSGWANETRTAYLCGRILDRRRYESLTGPQNNEFFPAYRAGDETASATMKPSAIATADSSLRS